MAIMIPTAKQQREKARDIRKKGQIHGSERTAAAPQTTISRLEANIKKYGAKNRPNDAKRLQTLRSAAAPAAAPAPAPVAAPAPVVNPTTGMGIDENRSSMRDANTLFPNTRMFEPENYQGSPLYQFQLQQGQKQLARSLAKRGLANSGHGIEEEVNLPLRVAAQDTDRMTRIASENADRLFNIQNNEANRLERQGNEQWNRLYSVADLMAAQSPWQGALGGLDASAGATKDAGAAQANFLKDYYKRIVAAGGGGGGGGGGAMPVPIPSGPDFGNITPTQIGGEYGSNTGWINLLSKGLSYLF